MRSKSILLLTLALGCGLVASIGISQVMDRTKAAPTSTGETEAIIVALTDINPHDLITPQQIKLEEWPKDRIPAGAIRKLEDLQGKRSRQKLYKDEPILTAKLMGSDEREGAAGLIPKGYRVVSVRVDAVTGASSLILPGDRVDVLVHFRRDAGNGINETFTKTILQDVKVFAVDTVVDRKNGEEQTISAKTVSLLATLDQAERITTATESGTIRLIMRGPSDNNEADSPGASVADLLQQPGEKTNREKEDAPHKETKEAAKSFQTWLKEQQDKVAGIVPKKETEAESVRWTMVLMQGTDFQEVELNGDGSLPTAIGGGPAAPQTPAAHGAPPTPEMRGDAPPEEGEKSSPSQDAKKRDN